MHRYGSVGDKPEPRSTNPSENRPKGSAALGPDGEHWLVPAGSGPPCTSCVIWAWGCEKGHNFGASPMPPIVEIQVFAYSP